MRMTVVNKKTVFVSGDADKFSELLRMMMIYSWNSLELVGFFWEKMKN